MCTVSPAVVLREQATEWVVLMSRAVVRASNDAVRRSLRFIFRCWCTEDSGVVCWFGFEIVVGVVFWWGEKL